jgi:hypothetical protein
MWAHGKVLEAAEREVGKELKDFRHDSVSSRLKQLWKKTTARDKILQGVMQKTQLRPSARGFSWASTVIFLS